MSTSSNLPRRSNDTDPWFADLLLSLIPFGFAWYTNSELLGLERGTVESVKMWVPFVWLYHHFGRWPVVLIIGSVGLFMIANGVRKLVRGKHAV